MEGARRGLLGAAVLAALALVPYAPSLTAPFVADDYVLLHTLDGLHGPLEAFAENDAGGSGGRFYRPLWVLANAAANEAGGGRPVAFHVLGLALLAAAVAGVWALARQLLAPGAALAAAALFAAYPRHAEPVAWITGSTDTLAGALALAALLAVVRDGRGMLLAGAALAAAAGAAKESAFVLPVLGALVLAAMPSRPPRAALRVGALAAGVAVTFTARLVVVGGAGGYGDRPWGIGQGARALASDVAAAFSPAQLDVLRPPALLAVPALLGALLLAAVARARWADPARGAVALAGLAWALVAVAPTLALVVDLPTANGERFLYLPSVGLALAVAAALPPRRAAASGLALAVAMTPFTVASALAWRRAGRLADDVVAQARALEPPRGELLLLAVPESYRTARVFGVGLDIALDRAGVRGRRTAWCAPLQVRRLAAGTVRFRRVPGGFAGRTGWSAPFTFPFSGEESALTPDCTFAPGPRGAGLGRGLDVVVRTTPGAAPVRHVFFDGARLVPLGAARAGLSAPAPSG